MAIFHSYVKLSEGTPKKYVIFLRAGSVFILPSRRSSDNLVSRSIFKKNVSPGLYFTTSPTFPKFTYCF